MEAETDKGNRHLLLALRHLLNRKDTVMASTGVSEFTFGFAFLYEQTASNWGNLRAVPVLPSLRQEAADAWDARLPLRGTDFYYQFKVSEYLQRRNATYIKDGTYIGPYFRFWIDRRYGSRQHNRLVTHAAANPETYYVAPEFVGLEEFNGAFLRRQMLSNSRLIPLSDCRPIGDDEHHCITYEQNDVAWLFHSQSERHEKSFSGREMQTLLRHSSPRWRTIDRDFGKDTLFSVVDSIKLSLVSEHGNLAIFERLVDFQSEEASTSTLLLRASDLLAAFMGLTLVIVGDRD